MVWSFSWMSTLRLHLLHLESYMCVYLQIFKQLLVCVVSLIDLFILHCSVTTACCCWDSSLMFCFVFVACSMLFVLLSSSLLFQIGVSKMVFRPKLVKYKNSIIHLHDFDFCKSVMKQ